MPSRTNPLAAFVLLAATGAVAVPAAALAQQQSMPPSGSGVRDQQEMQQTAPRQHTTSQRSSTRRSTHSRSRSAQDNIADQLNAESLRRAQAGQDALTGGGFLPSEGGAGGGSGMSRSGGR